MASHPLKQWVRVVILLVRRRSLLNNPTDRRLLYGTKILEIFRAETVRQRTAHGRKLLANGDSL